MGNCSESTVNHSIFIYLLVLTELDLRYTVSTTCLTFFILSYKHYFKLQTTSTIVCVSFMCAWCLKQFRLNANNDDAWHFVLPQFKPLL